MGSNGAGDSAVMTMAHRLRPPAEPYRYPTEKLCLITHRRDQPLNA